MQQGIFPMLKKVLLVLAILSASRVVTAGAVDYAEAINRSAWLHHPIYGDPSFDAFQRMPCNPVVRGADPYKWPVNGFFFEDPRSGNWYVYVGEYCEGYAIVPGSPPRCVVWRSSDKGATWERVGPIFAEPPMFEGESSPATHAPDVSVTFVDGKYHLCFDWSTDNTTWENAANPPPDANSGAAYAWADQPEGPFHAASRPIITTRDMQPVLGKYRRVYASTLLHRADDWLVLTLTDSGPFYGWALLGMTAASPEGPYSPPALLLHPEAAGFHPPLLEFFPAFTHEGFVYAPATSVAMNRNYQALFRAPIERANEPGGWDLFEHGSLWHPEPVDHEYFGIWGQTFSGNVSQDGMFRVLFPSRDSSGLGTINLAMRPWSQPYRERGFVLSGHQGPSLGLLRCSGPAERLDVELECTGFTAIVWDAAMPLGPDKVSSNAKPGPLSFTRYRAVELAGDQWRLGEVSADGEWSWQGIGACAAAGSRQVALEWRGDTTTLYMEGLPAWTGPCPSGRGLFGLITGPNSRAQVNRFALTGAQPGGPLTYLAGEALLGAAQDVSRDWEPLANPNFRFGPGAVSRTPEARAKWNFEGTMAAVWAPRGPDFGKGEISVDGGPPVTVDFHADEWTPSQPVFVRGGLSGGGHAVALRPVEGAIVLDVLEVQ